WEADEVASRLIDQGVVQEFIIVGIWNVPHLRHGDYFPQKPMELLTAEQIEFATNDLKKAGRITEDFAVRSNNYLKFVVTELKPVIDNKYAVYTDQPHTFVAGSSMGGLISMYALCEYPDVFGGAACLSTHWPGIFSVENNPIPEAFANYLSQSLPDPGSHLIYFDYGDQTLDALYPPLQAKIDSLMPLKGYSASQNWETNYFPGDDHSEKSWSRRLDVPFSFLLRKKEK
ncbi:MAG: alpha/beta hydrolase, partial [Bacteroidales bacterium]|nr:alpha/beta hydrolase [Bacteroidales bacterium]